MIRAALVMGFGFGRANEDIAEFVAKRHRAEPYEHILAQAAVVAWLRLALPGVTASAMHEHCKIYVNTLGAVGLGLMRLHRVVAGVAPVEVEVLAHSLQFERASDTAQMALTWLKRTPHDPADRGRFPQFLDALMLARPPSPEPMRLNSLGESWRQPWTCSVVLYRALEALARRRDFDANAGNYDDDPGAFYACLRDLERRLAEAGPRTGCTSTLLH